MPLSNIYTRTHAYSSVYNDALSFTSNQAALAESRHFSVGVFGERRFMQEDLSFCQLAFALPASGGNFGLQVNYFGSILYNESALGLAYARSLGKVDLGAQFNYFQINTAGYGRASAINFEAGAILHVSDQLKTGVHIYNPTRVSLGKNAEERLPLICSFGLGYDVSEKFFIGTTFEKMENRPVNINTGLQYCFDKMLFARTGVSSSTSSFYLGVGFLLNDIRIDATASLHPSLGITPGLMLIYTALDKK